MLTVSELFIYPVKSLGGISIQAADLTDRGFKFDRRWMLVDENNRFLSQREIPGMALLQTAITGDGIQVINRRNAVNSIVIPFTAITGSREQVQVWDDTCDAIVMDELLGNWFTEALQVNCRLVYMPDESLRKVDEKYAMENEVTSFSDGYPVLMIGQSSLDELNSRLEDTISMNRFRPNIVFTGGLPHEEDEMEIFEIGSIAFYGVKLCSRCVVTTIEQTNAVKGKEPLKTLSAYRQRASKIYFGQNVLYKGYGTIQVGDNITVIKKKAGFNQ